MKTEKEIKAAMKSLLKTKSIEIVKDSARGLFYKDEEGSDLAFETTIEYLSEILEEKEYCEFLESI